MGLFTFFNRKNGHSNGSAVMNEDKAQKALPEIPQAIFIEKEKEEREHQAEPTNHQPDVHGISILFSFLEKNHEGKGYDDALVNPDTTHLQQNITALKNELERTIRKVKIFYEDFIREINFHIQSRSRSGMIDTVEELVVKKDTAESHIRQIIEMERDALEDKGVCQSVLISYTRGFKNGLAAISAHSIMKKKF